MSVSRILTASYCAVIMYMIYIANEGIKNPYFDMVLSLPYGDKWFHFFLFGVLTFMVNVSLNLKTVACCKINIYLGTLIVASFVLLEEISQHFNPNRTFDLGDLAADIVGISLFTFLAVVFNKRYMKRAAKTE